MAEKKTAAKQIRVMDFAKQCDVTWKEVVEEILAINDKKYKDIKATSALPKEVMAELADIFEPPVDLLEKMDKKLAAARMKRMEQEQAEAAEKAKRDEEERVKREAEEQARREAEEKARAEAREKARIEAEEKAKREALEAEERAKREAEEQARREAEEKARAEAREKARIEAEEKAKLDAAAQARREMEENIRRNLEAMRRREAEEKARKEREAQAKAKARQEAEARAKREADAKAARGRRDDDRGPRPARPVMEMAPMEPVQDVSAGSKQKQSSKFDQDYESRAERRFDRKPEQKKFMPQQKKQDPRKAPPASELQPVSGEVHIKLPIIVKSLAETLGRRPNEVITELMMMNVLANINQTLDPEVAQKIAEKFEVTLVIDRKEREERVRKEEEEQVAPEDVVYDEDPKDMLPRPPIVTFMGHVDHGKTSLQDAIRKTHVADGEAGGITQHIGASAVQLDGRLITFVDTPGHEAFTQMRARGANVTDVVVLVVAADDGFMPQTIEAMHHAKAAGVPIVVAMNKCDLPDANTDKILLHMQQNELTSEDWGGTVAAIPVSARTGMGLDDLLERVLLEAEMLELKANPKRPGQAFVLESQLEQGFGPTANVVVKNGSLRVGDPVICGEFYGKVKTLIDYRGKRIPVAGPSMPVKVVGLSGVPEAGTKMAVCSNINEAKTLAESRGASNRIENLTGRAGGASLEDLFTQMDDAQKNTLKVIVKADVRGSSEAIVESLNKISSDKISIEVLHTGVGAITDNDVLLASSSGAIVVGFHVRVNSGVNELAKKEKVEIRLYSIIYELIEDITDAMEGRLEPEKREKEIGMVKIQKIFHLSNGQRICGCKVESGLAKVGSKARVFRGKELIFNGEVRSLRHFQEDVREVRQGTECGIRLDNFADFSEGDMIQLYEIELKKASLKG